MTDSVDDRVLGIKKIELTDAIERLILGIRQNENIII